MRSIGDVLLESKHLICNTYWIWNRQSRDFLLHFTHRKSRAWFLIRILLHAVTDVFTTLRSVETSFLYCVPAR